MAAGRSRNDWVVIGVPTSAGAHHAGQERAPGALRAAGLTGRLRGAGLQITDAGDLAGGMFAVDAGHPRARNLGAVAAVAAQVAGAVAGHVRAGRRPLVVGGDCTITLGVVAGVRRVHDDAGLAYVDGDADLGSLNPDGSGILDSGGIAHLLGYGEPELTRLAGEPPLLDPARLVMAGCDPRELSAGGRAFLAARRISLAEAGELTADPAGTARRMLATLAQRAGPFIVHFDVDVVDSGDLPLGNFPHYNSGVSLHQVTACLQVLVADPACAAMVLTEVNPTHDPDGSQLDRYLSALTTALAG
jgi:arginase